MSKPKSREPKWGGPRDNSGRPTVLRDAKPYQFLFEDHHREILEAYGDKVEANNRSDAMRSLLEQVNEDYDLGVEVPEGGDG